MTEQEALRLSLEVWNYLHSNPQLKSKEELPLNLYSKIEPFTNKCSLCEYYKGCKIFSSTDTSCPLFPCTQSNYFNKKQYTTKYPDCYESYVFSDTQEQRIIYSQQIIDSIIESLI